jgi:L-2-hydroxyglutarate oxidase LhgO
MHIPISAEKVGPVVIGAGVVGLAVARALSARRADVLILERQASFGSETSARNSEVVHGGLYYPADSLKARLCVRGRELLYDYCSARQVDVAKIGKLVVATEPAHMELTLPALHQQAQQNGYTETELLSAAQVQQIEPNVHSHGALWSPESGIVDSHGLMTTLLAEAEEQGAVLAVQSPVEEAFISKGNEIFLLVRGTWIRSDCAINCAGLWADGVAALLHASSESTSTHSWVPQRQYFARGNYFRLTGIPSPFSHLIYPVPDHRGGLGVHATLDRSHQVKFGPDVEWLDLDMSAGELDYQPHVDRSAVFYESIRRYWPDLQDGALQPDYVGVRPKLSHPQLPQHNPFHDFVIAGPKEHRVPGLVHLFGIESPGLTSSMAIAEYVCDLVEFKD